MILKNRIFQLIYHVVFLMICLIGILDCFNLLIDQKLNLDALVYYTTLSNMLCFIVIFLVSIKNYKEIKENKIYGKNEYFIHIKFYSTIIILITFIIYNFLLVDNMFTKGWSQIGNLTKHILAPLLFVLDYYLFDNHNKVSFLDTFLTLSLPLLYCSIIILRGELLPSNFKGTIYPYFFLNVKEVGLNDLIKWILILSLMFYVTALLIYLSTKVLEKLFKKY